MLRKRERLWIIFGNFGEPIRGGHFCSRGPVVDLKYEEWKRPEGTRWTCEGERVSGRDRVNHRFRLSKIRGGCWKHLRDFILQQRPELEEVISIVFFEMNVANGFGGLGRYRPIETRPFDGPLDSRCVFRAVVPSSLHRLPQARRPRGRRLINRGRIELMSCFNPRRPRGRRPASHRWPRHTVPAFQSTPPARAATSYAASSYAHIAVCFNPRRPRGRRPLCRAACQSTPARAATTSVPSLFQSTPPARAATSDVAAGLRSTEFQSTPPARAATAAELHGVSCDVCFNPRRPRGRRLRLA